MAIDVLRDHGILAVGHAVLAQVAWFHARRDDLEAAAAWRRRAAAGDPAAGDVPRRDRLTLPIRLTGRRIRAAESQQSSLLTRVGLDLQRRVVLPGDVHASRHTHDVCDAVRPTLIAAFFVLRGIPEAGGAAPFIVQRHAGVIAFARRDHAPRPVL